MARVRALSPADDDMQFGRGAADFYVNDKRCVAQNVRTRLGLYVGDWFLDTAAGTPWRTEVLGRRTDASRDPAIRARILGTPGVTALPAYASQLDRKTRAWTVQGTVSTAFGQVLVATALPGPTGDVREAR